MDYEARKKELVKELSEIHLHKTKNLEVLCIAPLSMFKRPWNFKNTVYGLQIELYDLCIKTQEPWVMK